MNVFGLNRVRRPKKRRTFKCGNMRMPALFAEVALAPDRERYLEAPKTTLQAPFWPKPYSVPAEPLKMSARDVFEASLDLLPFPLVRTAS